MIQIPAPTSSLLIAAIWMFVVISGCDVRSPQPSVSEAETNDLAIASDATVDFFELAKQLHERGDLVGSANAISKLLIQSPEHVEGKLFAANLEVERGNYELASEIAGSIPIDSAQGRVALDVRVTALAKAAQYSAAADALLAGIQHNNEVPRWRQEAWRLLNQVGRREEASRQAMALCRMGLVSDQLLLSLINQGRSFPTPEMIPDGKADLFSEGLGRARWHYSCGDFELGLAALADENKHGFQTPAAEALYGRLLAERQRWDEFRLWSGRTMPATKDFNDYWAGIGTYFVDNRHFEGAARALLEAVYRDPTDRISIQRLFSVMGSLGRPEDAEQFKFRGLEISNTEKESQTLYRTPNNLEARNRLARDLMELDRPFETLAWTQTLLPASAIGPRQVIDKQRSDLQQNPVAMKMAHESALLGIDPSQFQLDAAWDELLQSDVHVQQQPQHRDIAAQVRLVNRATELGLNFQWYKDVEIDLVSIPIHESLGGGIAVLDYDLDGWPDVYLAQGSGDPPTDHATRSNSLFRNVVNRFHDTTLASGAEDYNYSSGIAAGDVNQDGFPDLYLSSLGHNRLLINNGDGTYQDKTAQLGPCDDRFSTSVAIADINGDRLPDLFEANYIEMEGGFALPSTGPDGKLVSPTPLSHYADSDRWFEQLGNGQFSMHEIGREIAKPGTGLGVVVTDFDSDGKNEVFVGNDVRPNHLLVQTSNNGLVNVADSKGLANGFDGVANGCMGIATGDFDRNGALDLQIANYSLESANLFLQTPAGSFVDQARRYGLTEPTYINVGFGTKAADLDRNGFLDFIVTNGHIFDVRHLGEPYQMAPQLFLSTGDQLHLERVQDEAGYWDSTYLGRSLTRWDYDRDGATDFLVGHLDQPLAVLHNETKATGGWIQLELVGTASERDAIGARVDLAIGQTQQSEWVVAGDGYLSSDEPYLDFAFAEDQPIGQFVVRWPSGAHQTFRNVQRNHRYLVVEGDPEMHLRF